MEKIREYVRFFGRVQGVGFRYKANYFARHFGLTGWIRNEYDGSVEGEFQGLESEIDMVIGRLMQDDYIRIDRMERHRVSLNMEERGFSIKG